MDREKRILNLIATDKISIPINSIGGKLYRIRPKLAADIGLGVGDDFDGERCFARVESQNLLKARGMRKGIEAFSDAHPEHGRILNEMIESERSRSETHFYFGMHEGKRLTRDDYLGVMTDLGFSDYVATRLYPELMEISNKLSRKRDEDRSVLIG